MEITTIDHLLEVLRNPKQSDFDGLAISIMRNFCIKKQEADSFGKHRVRYRIVEMEFYLYNKETDDWPTYNRDCVAGQWFFHRSGVDIAFQTLRDGNELVQFGGILIRGLQKFVDDEFVGYIGGSQRCSFELFNNSVEFPELCASKIDSEFAIYKNKRVRIKLDDEKQTEFRYFRSIPAAHWETPRAQIFTKKINGEYHVFKDLKSVKYEDAILPDEGGMIEGTRVYPI